jgi:hypothetical protein
VNLDLKKGSRGILTRAKIGPAFRHKTGKVYPSLEGAKTSALDTKTGLLMHA